MLEGMSELGKLEVIRFDSEAEVPALLNLAGRDWLTEVRGSHG
jgi:hypothetical protein